jgi:hypothetical protein
MDRFLLIVEHVKKSYTKVRLLLIKLYNKLCFFFNKQLTLQKIYEPLTVDKAKINNALSVKLARVKLDNNMLIDKKESIIKENMLLKKKIDTIQELLIKK